MARAQPADVALERARRVVAESERRARPRARVGEADRLIGRLVPDVAVGGVRVDLSLHTQNEAPRAVVRRVHSDLQWGGGLRAWLIM